MCERLLFRYQVGLRHVENFTKNPFLSKSVSPTDFRKHALLTVRLIVHNRQQSGKMPPPAGINKLHMPEVPRELKCIQNTLEEQQVSLTIRFMK